MLDLELSRTAIFLNQNHQASCTERNTWISFLPVNLIPGYTAICMKENSKSSLVLTPQESALMVMGGAVLHIRFACHLDLFNWLWSILSPHILSLLTPKLSTGWRSWPVCTSQFGGDPSSVRFPLLQETHTTTSVTFSAWFPECFLSSAERFFSCVS